LRLQSPGKQSVSLIRFSIANPLITNLSLVLVMLLGVLSWYAMPQEMFPVVELDMARVTTVFEGASPEEVERQVTLTIEDEFDGMSDLDIVTSTSSEGLSTVILKLKPGSNVEQFMRDLRTRLDQISDLPEEAEEPELTRLEARFPVISMSLYGNAARGYLYQTADDVKRRLLGLQGVAGVGIAGDRDWELWVEVDPYILAARSVSLQQVIAALRDNLRDLPGGSLKSREGDIGCGARSAASETDRYPAQRCRWPVTAGRGCKRKPATRRSTNAGAL